MQFDIVTIFPDYFSSALKEGLLGKAIKNELIKVKIYNLRDFCEDKHKVVDDVPYGGGEGMVFKPEPLYKAICFLKQKNPQACVIYFSPQGTILNQKLAEKLMQKRHLILICGRYEGIDERIRRYFVEEEISIGDYVVFGGEVAALVLIEVISRLVPGVVGKKVSIEKESFTSGLLKYPVYTRPKEFMKFKVPEVLLSGNHVEIERYRRKLSLELTLRKRPYLLASSPLNKQDWEILKSFLEKLRLYLFLVHYPVLNKKGELIASAITNLDLHDLARLGRTYGIKGVYVVQILDDQREIGEKLVKYWLDGKGGEYNPLRKEAMKLIKFFKDLDEAIEEVFKMEGEKPYLLGTDAFPKKEFISYEKARELLWEKPVVLVLGTAWGLAEEVLQKCDYFLEPIWGRLDSYNHLSVRSAASIMVDRILGIYSFFKKI